MRTLSDDDFEIEAGGGSSSEEDSEISSITAAMCLDVDALSESIRRQSEQCCHHSVETPRTTDAPSSLDSQELSARGQPGRVRLRHRSHKPRGSIHNSSRSRSSRGSGSSSAASLSASSHQPPILHLAEIKDDAEMRQCFRMQLSVER